ncbi:hypothetical protein DVS28_b0588 (plasmid) [Euzebya pacifica]|uniref:Mce-associated membrane protein n=1 Tax=Euzebya pacifica TaxID=1608957 RepID=A0A346Y781_9ACTN|nr:hypothetical protein [Euzebya pacifica]AXV10328.1 hypothetical protein DVS28_b0588 [Euzebya pacifica]
MTSRHLLVTGAAIVVVVLLVLLAPLGGGAPPSESGGGAEPAVPPVVADAPNGGDGQVDVDLTDPTLTNPQPALADVLLDDEDIPQLDGEDLLVPASPRNVVSALDFAAAYYTIPAGLRTAEHRASLRPWVTDQVHERLTTDTDGLFDQADAVRDLRRQDSVGTVVEHSVVAEGPAEVRVLVVVEAMVTAGAEERRDTHSMLLTLTAPTVAGGRWLVADLVVNPISADQLS